MDRYGVSIPMNVDGRSFFEWNDKESNPVVTVIFPSREDALSLMRHFVSEISKDDAATHE